MIRKKSGAGNKSVMPDYIRGAFSILSGFFASLFVVVVAGLVLIAVMLRGLPNYLKQKAEAHPGFVASVIVHLLLLLILALINPNGNPGQVYFTEITVRDFSLGGDDDSPSSGKKGEAVRNPKPIQSISASEVNKKTQTIVDPSKVSGTGTDSAGTGAGGSGGGGLVVNLPEQKPVEKPVDNVYRSAVEEMPEPYGGNASIYSRVTYPETAKENNIRGTVYVLAFIDENGFVRRALLSKGIGGGCDEVALAAVRKTRFVAGRHKGEQVKVQMLIAVEFPPR